MIDTKLSQTIYLILCLLVTNTFATPTDQDEDRTQAKPASQTAIKLDDVFEAIEHNNIEKVQEFIKCGLISLKQII